MESREGKGGREKERDGDSQGRKKKRRGDEGMKFNLGNKLALKREVSVKQLKEGGEG